MVDGDHVVLDAVRDQVHIDLTRWHPVRRQVEDRVAGRRHRKVIVDLRVAGHVLVPAEDVLFAGGVRHTNVDRVANNTEVAIIQLQFRFQADADPFDERMEFAAQPFFTTECESRIRRDVEFFRQNCFAFQGLQVFVDGAVFELLHQLTHLVGVFFEDVDAEHTAHIIDELNRRIHFDMSAVRNCDVGVLVFEAGHQRLQMGFGRQAGSEGNRFDLRRRCADAGHHRIFEIDFAHDRSLRFIVAKYNIDAEATSFDVNLTAAANDFQFVGTDRISIFINRRECFHGNVDGQFVPAVDRILGEDVIGLGRDVHREFEPLMNVVHQVRVPVEGVDEVVLVALHVDHVLLALRDLEDRFFGLNGFDRTVHHGLDIGPDLEAERGQGDRLQCGESLLGGLSQQLVDHVLHSNGTSGGVFPENSIAQAAAFVLLILQNLVDGFQEGLCALPAFENTRQIAGQVMSIRLEQAAIEVSHLLVVRSGHTQSELKVISIYRHCNSSF